MSGEIRLDDMVLHPLDRTNPAPIGDCVVDTNPPPFLWPAKRASRLTYSIRLSQDSAFPGASSLSASGLPWAMYNPHRELAVGRWHWQFRTERGGEASAWSDIHSFRVDSSARRFVTPPPAEALRACPVSHPRVLVSAAELGAFRARVADDPVVATICRQANRYLGRPLPDESEGKPKKRGQTESQAKKFANWSSKKLGTSMGGSTKLLCMAYLATGDERYGREAVRRALHVASWDPKGVSRVNDFSDGACLRAMALAYDSCHVLLSQGQREVLRSGVRARAGRFFSRWRNNLEAKVFSAHIWQHILHDFADAAFAMLGEEPEAQAWASYVYELWLNRVPLLGGADGGWANGNNYFGTNFAALIEIPHFLQRLTGVDFMGHPWFRNAIYYQTYTWPPGSQCDGFGDGGEKGGLAGESRIAFVDILGHHFADPYGAWYVAENLHPKGRTSPRDSLFRWHRLTAPKESDSPVAPATFDLPQARLFPDIGVAAMHSDLANSERNVMVAFRSSPFASHNHMHADQNSFNILFGGRRLLANSGYYIAYGDPHFRDWYRASIGHNTVLIDGKGQGFGDTSYGWIPRFLHGRRISYCVGDASRAYPGTGLTRFRRHVAFLRPSTVVIYDDLAADHDAEWTWMLHSPFALTPNQETQSLSVQADGGTASVRLWSSGPLRVPVDSRFDTPADNWRGVKHRDGSLVEYADQWHARVTPGEALMRVRFLSVIQLAQEPETAGTPGVDGGNGVRAGDWVISAELDPGKPASLAARTIDGSAGLSSGSQQIRINGEAYFSSPEGSSLIVEATEGERLVRQTVDVPPAAAR
ncbi:MAG: DUF4962 domain-containing protein [Lentisphaerae bacterium]|nr:DUF4962 domain-containing protein [Lentisphaerota bacterium]